MAGGSKILKHSTARSVRLEQRGGTQVIVKRFEHVRALARAFDGARARREYEILKLLFDRGLPVPRPLRVSRVGRAHEVELEWIEGARSLREMLADGERLSAHLARQLGALLAGLQRAGVDHPDLHAGNVLVTEVGRAIAIDFDKARLRARLGSAKVVRDLVSLCAGLRESTSPRWRAVALAAWRRASESLPGETWKIPGADALELLARERRRHVVLGRERRWTRAGSAVVPLTGARGFARSELGATWTASAVAGEAPQDHWVRVDGTAKEVLALWRSMARLEEHAIAALRCQVLLTGKGGCAWFALEGPRHRAGARLRGEFLGGLLDRGLWCDGIEVDDLAGCGLIRARTVRAAGMGEAAALLAPWIASLEQHERAEFLDGVRTVFGGPARERDELLAALRHG